MRILFLFFTFITMAGCLGIPGNVKPVENFDVNRYLGKWYEIARLDHSFEKGLDKVTAIYTFSHDGSIQVINQGYSAKSKEWKSAKGKAVFVRGPDQGYLKVSFFGPFYSSYVIFELDKIGYNYAFVSGYNKSYLWLLSRRPKVSEKVFTQFIQRSNELGFNTDQMIIVKHD
jgi:apolipoprotein D and lipocalin family protein